MVDISSYVSYIEELHKFHKGFSSLFSVMQPIPKERLVTAREDIRVFLEGWKITFGEAGFTYKMHSMLHVIDDCENFGCHLEYLSSYPFENFHSKWKTWLRSGNKPLEQIRCVWNSKHKSVPSKIKFNSFNCLQLSRSNVMNFLNWPFSRRGTPNSKNGLHYHSKLVWLLSVSQW